MNIQLQNAITEGLRLKTLDENKHQAKIERGLPKAQEWIDKHLYKLITKETRRGELALNVFSCFSFMFSTINKDSIMLALKRTEGLSINDWTSRYSGRRYLYIYLTTK